MSWNYREGLITAGICASVLVVVYWLIFVISNSSNVPLMDDYDVVLDFLNTCSRSSVSGCLAQLLIRHNEHPIVPVQLVALFNYMVAGKVNFNALITMASFLWLLLLAFYLRDAFKRKLPFLAFALVLLFVNLKFATLITWSMAGLQHYCQLLFAYLSIRLFITDDLQSSLLVKLVKYPVLLLAVTSSGAGILILPLIFIHYLVVKNVRGMVVFGSVSLVIAASLMFFFKGVADQEAMVISLEWVFELTKFYLYFCGNLFSGAVPSLLLGLAINILMLILVVRHRVFLSDPLYFYMALLQMLVALAAGVSRALAYGSEYALESKYAVYSIVLLASVLMMGVARLNSIRWGRIKYALGFGVVMLCLMINVGSWKAQREKIETLSSYGFVVYPDLNRALMILRQAKANGIYDAERYISNYE